MLYHYLGWIHALIKANSYRSASTCCAYKNDVYIKEIMETANWTSTRTFYKHYHKEVDNDNTFVDSILN